MDCVQSDLEDQRFYSSPFQSSSHQTGKCKKCRPVTWKDALKVSRTRDSSTATSPEPEPSVQRPPNAPKPSLKLNEDNILFAGSRSFRRRSSMTKTNRKRKSSSQTFPQLPETAAPLDVSVLKTSTPFVRRISKRYETEDLLNSALIGAPRLALNSSLGGDFTDASFADRNTPSSFTFNNVSLDQRPSMNSTNERPGLTKDKVSSPIIATDVPQTSRINRTRTESLNADEISFSHFRCRICLEGGDADGALLSPCRCKGTVGLVHRTCLMRWLYESGKPSCELCGYAYIMTPSRRKSNLSHMLSPTDDTNHFFRDWINSRTTRRHLMTDIICLILLTPSTYIGVYFCIVGAIGFKSDGIFSWRTAGLWSLAFLIIALLTFWMVLATRHHVNHFQRYRFFRQRRIHEEAERLAALPRWRFSIQPRPRGSSMFLRSPPPVDYNSESYMSSGSSVSSPQPQNIGTCPRNGLSELAVQAHILPSVSSERTVSPKLLVSVSLSAVPELSEDFSSHANNPINMM